jgi:acetyl-CoA carboxylase biotin carboxyl carrier protein
MSIRRNFTFRKMKKPSKRTRGRSVATAPAPSARAPQRGSASGASPPTYDDLLAIVRLIESGSRFSDFRLRSGDIEVEVHRGASVAPDAQPPTTVIPDAAPASVIAARATVPPDAHVIKSPMVGTFYRSPEPGKPPFVEVGAKVEPDTIVCIIEVMKLMNSVNAGVHGKVTHVFVDNAQMVEYGQPLVAIRPAP